jgi:hypothetical protein
MAGSGLGPAEVMGAVAISNRRSEAGRKGAEALKARHAERGLTDAERRQRADAASARRH